MANVSSYLDWIGLANKGLIIWPKENVFLHDQSGKSRLNKLGSFFNDDGDGNERLAKKKNFARDVAHFVMWNSLTESFMEDVTTPWQIFLSPSQLWVRSQKVNSRKLTYIWRFKRVEIISIKKVWKTQRFFKCDVFRCDCLWRR